MLNLAEPTGDRIIAKQLPLKQQTDSGIYLPDEAQERPQIMEVVAVGSEVEEINVEDYIICSKFGTQKFQLNKEEYLVIHEEDILAIVRESEE